MTKEEQAEPLLHGEPLFKLWAPNGQRWALYANGDVRGFPPGTCLINRAGELLYRALRAEHRLAAAGLAHEQEQAQVG